LKTKQLIGLSIVSGILFSLAWPEIGNLSFLLFIAFVPLLAVEDEVSRQRQLGFHKNQLLFSYIAFLIFNVATTWWVWFASPVGSIAAMTINALFMAVIFQLFHLTKRIIGRKQGYIGLLLFWIGWEYIHISWDLTWPWLTLGNGFANSTWMVQWYEYTGVPGGSLWILTSNILIYHLLKAGFEIGWNQRYTFKWIFWTAVLLFAPVISSFIILKSYTEKEDPVSVVVVQPNIDPYNEKFSGLTSRDQVLKMMKLAKQKLSRKTQYVVMPETAIPDPLREDLFRNSGEFTILKSFVDQYPNLNIVTGASTVEVYGKDRPDSPTARLSNNGFWYDYYNTGLQINKKREIPFYHKSKLVPGVERMPFPSLFLPLQELVFDLGGASGSLGIQDERDVFTSSNDSVKIAPVICYESVYGEYVGNYVLNGAELIFIITNDGWWDDTPGYRQHLAYAKLRAIEHRRSIARSANTGVSCFINQVGEISQPTGWWEPAVIEQDINKNDQLTFYTQYGDYISRTSLFFGGFLLLVAIGKARINKDQKKK
tara:strand:- start:13944 stop:15563 length:1620 start_codon:yes stop_codon:yes gene_type:complete